MTTFCEALAFLEKLAARLPEKYRERVLRAIKIIEKTFLELELNNMDIETALLNIKNDRNTAKDKQIADLTEQVKTLTASAKSPEDIAAEQADPDFAAAQALVASSATNGATLPPLGAGAAGL